MPCIKTKCGLTGTPVTILVDTGSTNNYISNKCKIGKSIQIIPFETKTLHGFSVINSKKVIGTYGYDLVYYEIDKLNEFDMILGEQGFRTLKAEVNLFDYSLKYQKEVTHNVEQKINFTINNPQYEEDIRKLMLKNVQISETLPFTTTIQATIRTQTEEPI